jgi:16S rRNA (uracil1498-N3)-methyltransferase
MELTWPWGDRRCFFLERALPDDEPELDEADAQHLLRVLRARVDDRILGLDGCGAAWPLRIAALDRSSVEVERDGPPFNEPAPGSAGARVRRVEVAVAWPRPQAGEELLDGLVQLGCSRVTALVSGRSQDWSRDWSDARRARLERVVREACKQARRLWRIELDGPSELPVWLEREVAASDEARRTVLLDPRAPHTLTTWVRELRRDAPAAAVRLLIGPEGGWSDAERAACHARGLGSARIESFVLRTEVAAQAAAAIALAL